MRLSESLDFPFQNHGFDTISYFFPPLLYQIILYSQKAHQFKQKIVLPLKQSENKVFISIIFLKSNFSFVI